MTTKNPASDWTLEDVMDYARRSANSFIVGRQCKFEIHAEADAVKDMAHIKMLMQTANVTEVREIPVTHHDSVMEILDLVMVKLTHMAVNCGLIETTPKNATHHISISGRDWQETEVQLDGHTLRGVYSVEMNMKAGEEQQIKFGFSRSMVHLDQQYLPKNMRIEIEGMDKTLGVLRSLVEFRENGFKNEETGEQFAKLHSSNAEVELYRDAYETLKLYEAVMEDDSIVEAGSSNRVH